VLINGQLRYGITSELSVTIMNDFTLSRGQKMFHVTFFAIKNSFVKATVMIPVGKAQIYSPL